jgi:hypothetical protein
MRTHNRYRYAVVRTRYGLAVVFEDHAERWRWDVRAAGSGAAMRAALRLLRGPRPSLC